MNLFQLEEAKKIFDKGKPLVEKAVAGFTRDRVKSFITTAEFEIRKAFGISDDISSKNFRKKFMEIYDEQNTKEEEDEEGEEG